MPPGEKRQRESDEGGGGMPKRGRKGEADTPCVWALPRADQPPLPLPQRPPSVPMTPVPLGQARARKLPKQLPSPKCTHLVKWKSNEYASPPILKCRRVVTQGCHIFSRPKKIMGRPLSLFWKQVLQTLDSCEALALTDLLHMLSLFEKVSCLKHQPVTQFSRDQ